MKEFEQACQCCQDHWKRTSRVLHVNLPSISRKKQKENERYAKVFIKQIKENFTSDQWKIKDQDIKSWMQNNRIWNLSWLMETEKDSFLAMTKCFIKDARMFDKELSFADIGQALRNVWIFAILEKLFQRPIAYHKAIFAYSMLYPYTDNFLDDPTILTADKVSFNDWFTLRLRGKTKASSFAVQEKVDALVTMIEDVYPRDQYAAVYEALLLIQEGQSKSLLQKDEEDELALLAISIEKGGASVLADGYLMNGELSAQEIGFCVEYGFMLQIADDIQDIVEDGLQGHHTLISILDQQEQRGELCNRLLNYIPQVMDNVCPNKEVPVLKFITEHCMLLVIFSIFKNHHLYPLVVTQQIADCLPLSTVFLNTFFDEGKGLVSDNPKLLQMIDSFVFT